MMTYRQLTKELKRVGCKDVINHIKRMREPSKMGSTDSRGVWWCPGMMRQYNALRRLG